MYHLSYIFNDQYQDQFLKWVGLKQRVGGASTTAQLTSSGIKL